MDYHTVTLQKWRLKQAVTSVTVREAMLRADRRDSTLMFHAELDRECPRLTPQERALKDLADLREYDRYRFPKWNKV